MKKEKRQTGKSTGLVIVLVVLLAGMALVTGWWYGRKSATRLVPARVEPKKPPAKKRPRLHGKAALFEDRIVAAAEEAMPAVVNVFSEKVIKTWDHSPFFSDPFFRFFFGPGLRGIPRERRERSLGSGVIVTADGYILTNNHVVENADRVKVALIDKREFEAKIVGADPQTDLAVLKIEADDLPVLPLGDSDQVEVGQIVLAIGNPFGLSGSVSMGIVSALGRTQVGITDYEDFIQTDAAINPGNSGGALINLDGELVGINTAIFTRSGGYQGIGFAIPSNLARSVMGSLIQSGTVERGWLGVSIQDLTPNLAEQFGLSEPRGALVAEVFPDTPAAEAGLEPGDVITAVNGKKVDDSQELRIMIASYAPGTEVELEIIREGEPKTISVKLGKKPSREELAELGQTPSASGQAEAAGMTVHELTPRLADQLGIEFSRRGVVVVDVKPGSRADRAGIQVGDIILKINRRPVNTVADFKAEMRKAGDKPVLLRIRRGRSTLFIVIPE